MRAVRSKHTAPEMAVRRLVHALGYRFRVHRRDLPGNPDLVFPGRRTVVFVHGCWWHGHDCRRGARVPKTNAGYWTEKVRRNVERDRAAQQALAEAGWRVLVLWECDLKDRHALAGRLQAFLGQPGSPSS